MAGGTIARAVSVCRSMAERLCCCLERRFPNMASRSGGSANSGDLAWAAGRQGLRAGLAGGAGSINPPDPALVLVHELLGADNPPALHGCFPSLPPLGFLVNLRITQAAEEVGVSPLVGDYLAVELHALALNDPGHLAGRQPDAQLVSRSAREALPSSPTRSAAVAPPAGGQCELRHSSS